MREGETNRSSLQSRLLVSNLDRLARELHGQKAALALEWKMGGCALAAEGGEVLDDDPKTRCVERCVKMHGVFSELEKGLSSNDCATGDVRRRSSAAMPLALLPSVTGPKVVGWSWTKMNKRVRARAKVPESGHEPTRYRGPPRGSRILAEAKAGG
jgi:hypothetical protein